MPCPKGCQSRGGDGSTRIDAPICENLRNADGVDAELIDEPLEVGGLELRLLRPPDAEALIDEEQFEAEEFLPYWAELWPAGRALAEALPARLRGRRVVELGCGLALPSLVAAARGAQVLATDWAADAVELVRTNAERNGLALEARVARWDEPEAFGGGWDLILAADVLYEARNAPQLLALLPRLGGEVLLAEPGRPPAQAFFREAEASWRVDEVAHRVYRLSGRPAEAFDFQPTLRGSLLCLRPLRADDLAGLHAAAADPLVWEQHPERDRYREHVFRPYFEGLLRSQEALVAIDRTSGEIVGMSRFHGYAAERSEVEIGWTFLARSRWGGAYNRELKALMLTHAFRFVSSVVFLVAPENVRSRRAVEKIGGVPAGSRPDASGRECLVYRIDAAAAERLTSPPSAPSSRAEPGGPA